VSHSLHLFCWEGVDRLGHVSNGQIYACNIIDARVKLREKNLVVRSIIKQRNSIFNLHRRAIKSQEIMVFARQLATTTASRIPFIQALELISSNQNNVLLKQLLISIHQDIESGLLFSESLKKHPKFFCALFCNLVAVGESSGTLNQMLLKIAIYLENKERLKQKIKKSLIYPLTLIGMAGLVTVSLFIFIIPQFESLFSNFGAELPKSTAFIISLSQYIQKYGHYSIFLIVSCSLVFRTLYRHCESIKAYIDKVLLLMPISGSILQKIIVVRFTSTISITYAAGLPLIDALKLVLSIVGNRVYFDGVNNIITKVMQGETLQLAMHETHLFPDFVINMISLGEESGRVEDMLRYVSDYYEKSIEQTIDTLSNLLEPFIMTVLGIIIGCLVFAMYFPILKLGSVV
jgi:type IV pilus assembly protein PilC